MGVGIVSADKAKKRVLFDVRQGLGNIYTIGHADGFDQGHREGKSKAIHIATEMCYCDDMGRDDEAPCAACKIIKKLRKLA